MNALEIAGRLGPDVLFGGIAAAMTPGDIVDKAIVGGTQVIGGSAGGLLAGKMSRNPTVSGLLDFGGSIAGDMVSQPAADMILRGKDKVAGGPGKTPYEKLSDEQRKQLSQQIDSKYQAYGLVSCDPYLVG